MFVYRFIHLIVRPSIHPSVRPSAHPSLRPSVRPSVLSIWHHNCTYFFKTTQAFSLFVCKKRPLFCSESEWFIHTTHLERRGGVRVFCLSPTHPTRNLILADLGRSWQWSDDNAPPLHHHHCHRCLTTTATVASPPLQTQ